MSHPGSLPSPRDERPRRPQRPLDQQSALGRRLNGGVDDVRLYDHPLTTAEVALVP